MELKLIRRWKKAGYTIGELYVDGVWFSNTLEDRDRGLTQDMPLSEIKKRKVPKETAIPTGVYEVTLKTQSQKFKDKKNYQFCNGYLPRLKNVPGYSGILIHVGNWASDSAGCILVGENKVKGGVVNSVATFQRLYKLLQEADKITITIV